MLWVDALLCNNIIVKENEKADARHFAGDLFDSFDDAFEMLKMYYALDDNYIKNKDNYYMGFAIYATGKYFAYSGAVDYQTLLNLQYVANDGKKPIRAYVFPEVIDNKISIEQIKNLFNYYDILFYINNGNGIEKLHITNDKIKFKDIYVFKERYGRIFKQFSDEHGINVKYIEALIFCESTSGDGFYDDGRLLIRFENYTFAKKAGISMELVKSDSYENEFYRKDINSPWISIHDTPDTKYSALKWAISINEEAAYSSISMGFPQILGSNYKAVGYNSAKEMFLNFSIGYIKQINGFFSFIKNDRNGKILKALKNNNIREVISLYNGPDKIDEYMVNYNYYLKNY